MSKRMLVTGLMVISIGCSIAGATPNPEFYFRKTSDTTDLRKKDSLTTVTAVSRPADPKEGFKNLFMETESQTTGIRVEQLNPLAIGFVEDYMEKYSDDMEDMKDWGRPYFDMMETILSSYDLPVELKYLAVVESRLKNQARSWAGAVGPWQFMPSTARVMGLKVNKYVDERRDFNKSTHAAAKYLVRLFDIYGDWLLVIAAYNSGPGTVNSAIRRSKSRDFWVLQKYLPAESRNHVKKFIATHFIMEGEGGITTLTKKEAGLLLTPAGTRITADDSTLVKLMISGRYHSSIVVRHLTMELSAFNSMNPAFDKTVADNGKYELRLPKEKMDLFLLRKPDILAESLQYLLNPEYNSQARKATP